MKVNIEYQEELNSIQNTISSLPDALEGREKEVLRKIGTILKKNVISFLDKSDVEKRFKKREPKNFDGSAPYVHMKNDVKSRVRKSKDGTFYVSVGGGKMTAHKWHLVNDGTIHTKGNNFVDKAIRKSDKEVQSLIDSMLAEVIK